MFEVRQTEVFLNWLDNLRDRKAQAAIAQRIVRMQSGLMGDVKYFDGIGEARVHFGPGYRLYFKSTGKALIILLCGGDKASQERDIRIAVRLGKELGS